MKAVFGDSFYFLALANPRDAWHARAVEFARHWRGVMVTPRWVPAEVGDGLSGEANRALAVRLIERVTTSARFRVALRTYP